MSTPDPLSPAGDFPRATAEQWRRLVAGVLKGAPFERLETKTFDGLTIEPLYPPAAAAQPITGRTPGGAWTLLQRVDHPDPAAANALALDDLKNGATGLSLVFAGAPGAGGYGLDASTAALSRTLDGVALDRIAIGLDLSPSSHPMVGDFAALGRHRGLSPASLDLRFGLDPIGGFAATGKSPRPWTEAARDFAGLVDGLLGDGYRGPFAVADGRVVHDAGGSPAQELAFALATGIAYLRALETHGLALEAARDAIYFRLSADADQFLTTAKFRAARKLWARVEAACGLAPKPLLLEAETAWRMMTKRDPYVNMLRTTVAVAAAGFGGADAITALPYTAPLGLPDALARRVARNTQLVLLEESNLARVADPSAGSGAIEAFTDRLCAAAWALFQDVEKAGGAWPALETGSIQQAVGAVRAERQSAVARGEDVLTGSNAFPNLDEIAPAVLDVAPRVPAGGVAAAVATAPLPRLRLAEPFEALRDRSDEILAATGARPKIFLAAIGSPAEFTARAGFARNFFAAGGIEPIGGEDAGPAVAGAFRASGAALACLCSSDKVYDDDAAAVAQALKAAGAGHIYLAGRPGEREPALRAAGVASFVFDGCDAVATLAAAYAILDREAKTGRR